MMEGSSRRTYSKKRLVHHKTTADIFDDVQKRSGQGAFNIFSDTSTQSGVTLLIDFPSENSSSNRSPFLCDKLHHICSV